MCLSSELSGLLSLWALVVVCAEGQLIEFSEATGEWTVATFSADMATDSSSAVLFCSALLCSAEIRCATQVSVPESNIRRAGARLNSKITRWLHPWQAIDDR